MKNPLKFLIPGLAAAGLASVIGLGVVLAQTGDDGTPTPAEGTAPADDHQARLDDYLDRLAENLGVSREQLDSAMKQTALDTLDQAVADGLIDEDRAAEIREMIESGEGLFGLGPRPFGGSGHGFREGHGPFRGGPFGGHSHDGSGSDSTGDGGTSTSNVS